MKDNESDIINTEQVKQSFRKDMQAKPTINKMLRLFIVLFVLLIDFPILVCCKLKQTIF